MIARSGAFALSACLVAACAHTHERAAGAPAAEWRLTNLPGDERNARFSPDGEWVAFGRAHEGQSDIWLVRVADGELRQLTSTPYNESGPAWSPDGRTVAFAATRDGRTGIWAIPAEGGEARALFAREGMAAFSPDYAADGRLAATIVQRDPARSYGDVSTWVMDGDGGNARRLTTGGDTWHARWDARGEWLYYYVGQTDALRAVHGLTGEERNVDGGQYVGWTPSLSPDGRRIAFVSTPGRTVWSASLSDPSDLRQVSRRAEATFPAYSPDGGRLVFSQPSTPPRIEIIELATGARSIVTGGEAPRALANGEFGYLSGESPSRILATVERGAAPSRTIETSLSGVSDFSISASGALTATVTGGAQRERGLFVERNGAAALVLEQRAFTPRWCGGDSAVYYTEEVGEFIQIFSLDLATGERTQLSHDNGGKQITSCAADGAWIAYTRYGAATNAGILRNQNSAWTAEEHPDWSVVTLSPDGQRTAYVSRDAEGVDLFVRDANGAVTRLTRDWNAETAPTFSADGRHLAFVVREEGQDLWVASLDGTSD